MDWTTVYGRMLGAQAHMATWTALLLALVALVSAVAKVVEAIEKLMLTVRKIFRGPVEEVNGSMTTRTQEQQKKRAFASLLVASLLTAIARVIIPRTQAQRKRRVLLGIALAIVGLSIPGSRYFVAQKLPPNVRLTTEAWEAFNRGDFGTTIQKAQECIDKFQDEADDEQKQLEKDHVTVPKGVVSKEQKEEIVRRGPLNDVATCFFVKGQAAEKLGQNDEAKQAYTAATKYPYARGFDPSWDGFWSPADAARGRLKHLK